jgi:hypothetical protein
LALKTNITKEERKEKPHGKIEYAFSLKKKNPHQKKVLILKYYLKKKIRIPNG